MVVVADTGAMLALLDADDRQHRAVRASYEQYQDEWVLPDAILAELDYLIAQHLGSKAQNIWLDDLAGGRFTVVWHVDTDLDRAVRLHRQYRGLRLGLVDGLVIAIAERLGAEAIATLDLRHFGAIAIAGEPRLLPRDA